MTDTQEDPKPPLVGTSWWMFILASMILWYIGKAASHEIDFSWFVFVFFCLMLYGAYDKHMEIVGKRQQWREKRYEQWIKKDLPELD